LTESTVLVTDLQEEAGADGEVGLPTDAGASLGTKVLDSIGSGLVGREEADEVRANTSSPSELDRLADNNAQGSVGGDGSLCERTDGEDEDGNGGGQTREHVEEKQGMKGEE